MRDVLRFDVAYSDGRLVATCGGYDRGGHPVDFELDLETLRGNLGRQYDWVRDVQSGERMLRALVAQGMDPNAAWSIVSAIVPDPLEVSTAARSADPAERGAQDGDEMLESDGDGFR